MRTSHYKKFRLPYKSRKHPREFDEFIGIPNLEKGKTPYECPECRHQFILEQTVWSNLIQAYIYDCPDCGAICKIGEQS